MSNRKTSRLKQLIRSPGLTHLMEAHNGLSARIVEETGFPGIWASGLSLSASLGVRDCNEATWSQALEIVEFMNDAVSIPILMDGDSGHGNFNTARRFARKAEQRGVAGLCIEDRIFPKRNSFNQGGFHELESVEEFAGKIRAIKDSTQDPDFTLIARVEALIAGLPMEEALTRAHAYREAGADAILIHSKKSVPDEVLEFKRLWGNACPVVIVPTKYFRTPSQVFEAHGFSTAIWANHLMRASLASMKLAAESVLRNAGVLEIEPEIASIEEVFRLQREEELNGDYRRFASHAVS